MMMMIKESYEIRIIQMYCRTFKNLACLIRAIDPADHGLTQGLRQMMWLNHHLISYNRLRRPCLIIVCLFSYPAQSCQHDDIGQHQ